MGANTLNVELTESLRGYLKERVARGEYADEADYVRDLIQRDREQRAAERLRGLVQDGVDSGPSRSMTEDDWADLRARGVQPAA